MTAGAAESFILEKGGALGKLTMQDLTQGFTEYQVEKKAETHQHPKTNSS